MQKEIKDKFCRLPTCRKQFKPFTTLQRCCSQSHERELQKSKKEAKEVRQKELGVEKKKDLFELARITFNAYIRERDKGKDCICCGEKLQSDYQCGHFHNGFTKSNVIFDEDNAHGQNKKCNEFLSGNLTEYAIRLEKLIGVDRFNVLREKAYETKVYSTEELQRIITHYRKQTKILKDGNMIKFA